MQSQCHWILCKCNRIFFDNAAATGYFYLIGCTVVTNDADGVTGISIGAIDAGAANVHAVGCVFDVQGGIAPTIVSGVTVVGGNRLTTADLATDGTDGEITGGSVAVTTITVVDGITTLVT